MAVLRMKGVTQSQLSKEFGMGGKYMFYILKSLESRGLIMKHSALVRTNEPGAEGESINSSSVTTNVLYLYRYAKQLGLQQKFEITKDEEQTYEGFEDSSETFVSEECFPGDYAKENVVVKDYQPIMKAICDKLEATEDKVLVVSDVKQHLGYHGAPSAHRAWRNICRRLKDAHLVEEFEAKVNGKVQKCLRLLKNFPRESIEPQPLGSGKSDQGEEFLNFGRRSLVTEQTAELPIEHQVFDMIDAEGPNGLAMKEACKRLGIGNKQNHSRLLNMFSRFGIHLEAQNSKKGFVYRAWTPENFNKVSADAFAFKEKSVDSGSGNSKLDPVDKVAPYLPENFTSSSEDPFVQLNSTEILSELSCGNKGDIEADNVLASVVEPKGLLHQPEVSGPNSEVDFVALPNEKSIVPSEASPPSLRSCKSESHQRYPCLSLTADGARREQRILEKVQREKFILRGELYRWLVSFEKDKCTTMDRKTIDRIVNKLQKQGQCKCAYLKVPTVTNCRRTRSIQVVLHPSIQNLSPELISEIHDRMRSFEMLTRGHGSSNQKNTQSVPVLDSVERIQSRMYPDATATKSEAMRANGFVLAKMVRAKLLHCFLWDYLHAAPDCGHDFLPTSTSDANNPHSSCRLFSLEEAIKAIPLELFLQVAGSTQKFDDMINKCKRGFCLTDLPPEEYRVLMDTQATGRLSVIIDILQRLKLIRLVNNGHREDGVKVPHAVLTHAMELKPYIEEPLSSVAKSMSLVSLDLRPRIRHDFFLSNRGAVDEYWQTLEYCYAATDPRAAIHAFPGSSVHEVFFFRSWASVRVMTAEQRAELRKRIMTDANEKLPYHECEKIAKDLNLTLEQVLRVYYDRRQKRLNTFHGVQNVSRKRKRSSEEVLSEHDGIGVVTELGHGNNDLLSDSAEQFIEEQVKFLPSLDKPESQCQDAELDNCLEEPGPNEGDEGCSSRTGRHEPTGTRTARQRRSLWSDEADRQLVILYARNRAFVGAKFHRTDWASLPDLPAPPSACGKRMASLNKSDAFRKSLMRLCNLLGERYTKELQKNQEKQFNCGDDGQLVRGTAEHGCSAGFSTISQITEHDAFEEDRWDDFSVEPIKTVLEEVLQCKRMNKLEVSKRVGSSTKEWSNLNIGAQHDSQVLGYVSSANTRKDIQENTGGQTKGSLRRSKSSCRRLQRKFIRLWNDGGHVSGHICESLAVSNAVELFKLVFLNSSTASEVPSLLAESLRRYSQHDLFSAFSYLREKKILIGGSGSQPFTLSQNFLHDISKSMFPSNTGKRVAKFSKWLDERENDLDNEKVVPTDVLQCGDTIYLFALVSSGEFSLFPSMPEEGVGEAEESRNLKRRADDNESYGGSKYKKLKSTSECEVVSRREKGFPGIIVSIQRATMSKASSLELFKDAELRAGHLSIQSNDAPCSMLLQTESNSSGSDCAKKIVTSANTTSISGLSNGSIWDSMTRYANEVNFSHTALEQGSVVNPNVFRVMYSAIQRAGDQGLSMREISDVVDMPGLNMPELLVEVLQLFGLALKVNSFDSVRVVNSLFRSKYFLTSIAGSGRDLKELSSTESLMKIGEDHLICHPRNDDLGGANSERETITNVDQMHKVTILNLPEEIDVSADEVQHSNAFEGPMEGEVNLSRGTLEIECSNFSSGRLCMPILPWINGDGTVNRLVYRALIRRVLGIVMLNPGILEDEIIGRLDVLNPQSCRKLLELMVLDKHLNVRKMHQTQGSEPPHVMKSLLGGHFRESKFICREHFFANPMSASLL
ncbi:uncharacterized protein LOC115737876 isoform X2 [Rhodamnia argentea]|uniref:Uncharacterized protein LOC115737876 isoform X2 n=1 Tax=Rhodamnia argentea TaxID=178133 RepID=A0A8B8NUB3_9MYRT|nr:uncharacterized protein LOC115737876 isoform X2 [Rhodamnia argentea]XP_030526127.1 uncharacterized protein LOC115737876 isoform X2 [Rhodamnia argentea]